jgi:hypothetical protein
VSFQQNNIAGKPKLISIVGDVSRFDADELAEFGTVKQVQVDDIFVE